MNSKVLMRRTRRAAQTLKEGVAILDRLILPDAIDLMIQGANEEVPSVSKIDELLLEDFDERDLKQLPVRQFIGQACKAIMASEGFDVAETGVRIPDSRIFSTGAVYARRASAEAVSDGYDLLDRLVDALADGELRHVQRRVEERLLIG